MNKKRVFILLSAFLLFVLISCSSSQDDSDIQKKQIDSIVNNIVDSLDKIISQQSAEDTAKNEKAK